ncbi:hypothetical protein J7384_16955 [Endozoicomonas sp. G2_1]|uniref:hypothetical protein n=1 Tax=Endozoicomonas sp. G2_1 TaxID=2821091 RepID=UPI001ADA0C21|nr:hypothetical protein [Endozoicomonas sp. G2_1]MBO9492053.1 hypothetical protein [Endozoicomonas sp. G2_1]
MEFSIKPHNGIGLIKLGMPRAEVRELLNGSFDSSRDSLDYYFNCSLQVEFENDLVSFIGLALNESYVVTYFGVNVFDVEASDLFALISANEPLEHTFERGEYVFPEQIITLYDADEQYDYIGNNQRSIWGQIGLGSKAYLKAVSGV